MFATRRTLVILLALAAPLVLAACQGGSGQDGSEFQWQPVFGDNSHDVTPVIARVDGVEITEDDLELRFDELPPPMQRRYEGEEGRRLLLRKMVEQVLLVRGAVDRELYNDQRVARTLISQRRAILDQAMRNIGLFEGAEPTTEQLQAFFQANRDRYQIEGRVLARHVECLSEEDANRAYERLVAGGPHNTFPYVVKEMSVNRGTKELEGSLGWFNDGGFIPHVLNSEQLAKTIYAMPDGLNPPVRVGNRWHVVEVLQREQPRPMTFNEARDTVKQDYLPTFQQELVDGYLADARRRYAVELYGRYAPGGGVSDEALFQRAVLMTDPERRLEVLKLLIDEYPESDRADEALFLAAQAVMDRWQDTRQAAIYLQRLVDEHPNSEMVEDARYLLENLDNPNAWAPQSIEDLRR